MVNENSTRIWTNGYIVLGASTRIPVQEVSVDLSRDLKEHYNSGVSQPSALVPGQEKIEFKIKRIFSSTTMMKIYLNRCQFNMILFNNSNNPGEDTQGEAVCSLTGCMLSKNSLSSMGKGGDPVTEDITGKALNITFKLDQIASMVNPTCTNL
jgi:hypothetical protein